MKEIYTATFKQAQYVGSHPHIKDKSGVFYWNTEQDSFIFRPDVPDGDKSEWYRVNRENLIESVD